MKRINALFFYYLLQAKLDGFQKFYERLDAFVPLNPSGVTEAFEFVDSGSRETMCHSSFKHSKSLGTDVNKRYDFTYRYHHISYLFD